MRPILSSGRSYPLTNTKKCAILKYEKKNATNYPKILKNIKKGMVIIMAEVMFAKVSRGYDRGQVDAFLLELNRTHAEKEAAWESQKRELEAALAEAKAASKKSEEGCGEQEQALRDALEEKERECVSLQASIGKRMLMADARAEEILADAERKAAEMLADAERQSSEMLADAESRSSELLADAESRSSELLADAERQSSEMLAEAHRSAEEETARIVSETQAKCAVIGQAADAFAERIGVISTDLRQTENAINDAMEDLRRKALGDS